MAFVTDITKCIHLIHHQFFHGELVDDFHLGVSEGIHTVDIESDNHTVFVFHIHDLTRGPYFQLLIRGIYRDVFKSHVIASTANPRADFQWKRKVFQDRGKDV